MHMSSVLFAGRVRIAAAEKEEQVHEERGTCWEMGTHTSGGRASVSGRSRIVDSGWSACMRPPGRVPPHEDVPAILVDLGPRVEKKVFHGCAGASRERVTVDRARAECARIDVRAGNVLKTPPARHVVPDALRLQWGMRDTYQEDRR